VIQCFPLITFFVAVRNVFASPSYEKLQPVGTIRTVRHFFCEDGFLSLELKSAEPEDISEEILACEEATYATFLGPKPDVETLEKLLTPDFLHIQWQGIIWTREENISSLKSGVVFSSIEIKDPRVRRLSPNSAVIVARVLIEASAGGRNLSTDNLTSTVWVKRDGKWLAQLHTATATAKA
jgi:hypothetical protein